MKSQVISSPIEELAFVDKCSQEYSSTIPDELIASLKRESSRKAKLSKIFNYIKENVEYKPRRVGSVIIVSKPETLLKEGFGDNLSLLIFAAAVLRRMNIDFSYCLCKFNDRDFFQHAFLVIPEGSNIDNGFWSLDLLAKKAFQEVDGIIFRQIIPGHRL